MPKRAKYKVKKGGLFNKIPNFSVWVNRGRRTGQLENEFWYDKKARVSKSVFDKGTLRLRIRRK